MMMMTMTTSIITTTMMIAVVVLLLPSPALILFCREGLAAIVAKRKPDFYKA
jgi:hypothetical protein